MPICRNFSQSTQELIGSILFFSSTVSDVVYSRTVARRASTSSTMCLGTVSAYRPLSGINIKCTRLVAANYSGCSGACLLKRNCETVSACKIANPGDWQYCWCLGHIVESSRGINQYWPSSLLFVTSRRVQTNNPDITPIFYSNSLPTGFASSHARSSAVMTKSSSLHRAKSSSSV